MHLGITFFFKCLVPTILRHKTRLSKTVRDTIVTTWIGWLRPRTTGDENNSSPKKKQKVGSIDSPAHQYLLCLLNDWASNFGNLLMPRDLLLKTATEVAQVTNDSESKPERKMSSLWKDENQNDTFLSIKIQYDRLLSRLPESHCNQLKDAMGIEARRDDGAGKSSDEKTTQGD